VSTPSIRREHHEERRPRPFITSRGGRGAWGVDAPGGLGGFVVVVGRVAVCAGDGVGAGGAHADLCDLRGWGHLASFGLL